MVIGSSSHHWNKQELDTIMALFLDEGAEAQRG